MVALSCFFFKEKKKGIPYIPLDEFPTNKVQVNTIIHNNPSVEGLLKLGSMNITTVGRYNMVITTFYV